MTTATYRMKEIMYPVRQHLAMEQFMRGTENVAMMFSIKWRRPYESSAVRVRGDDAFGTLTPELKDIMIQLGFNTLCEFKKARSRGKLITIYNEGRYPTAETPDPRGQMAQYQRYDAANDEDDYYVTFGDTGKPALKRILNAWGVGVGAGELMP